jgi:hypothetical protein
MVTTREDNVDQKDSLQDKVGQNHRKDSKPSYKDNNVENRPKHAAYKYSNDRKGPLYESVIVAGLPSFITYENGHVKMVDYVDEPSRIIRPYRKEEHPYPPYEFANVQEIQRVISEAKNTNIESLYLKAKDIVLKYVDQEEPIIIMIVTDIIWSYYQDLFPTTHYVNVTGDNETGKSTIGYVFQYTGYRPVRATAISAANYYRSLGIVEPGQCTIIEDEADSIEEDKEKMKILKDGYQLDAKVPKTNMNTRDQTQNWFYAYCLKIMISEKPLSPIKAKGLKERTFNYQCRAAIKDDLLSIKEVTINPPADPKRQGLYTELMDFRKLMLCYRLTHYKEYIPDIKTELINRDNELGGQLLRIFHDTKVLGDIKYALQKFLTERKAKKEKTIESALEPLIVKLVTVNNTLKLHVGLIWNEAINTIPGRLTPEKPNEYQTNEYGTIYMNTFSKTIVDTFGAVREKKNNGVVLVFDEEKINRLKTIYGYKVQDQEKAKPIDPAPDSFNVTTAMEDNNPLEDDGECSESSEGYRVCGFIIE